MEQFINWREKAQPYELNYWKKQGINQYKNNDTFLAWWNPVLDWIGRENIKGRMLDIGCGVKSPLKEGYIIEPLVEEYKEIGNPEWWRNHLTYSIPVEEYIPGLPEMDFILYWNALDHGYDFRQSLQNVKRYLKTDGVLALSTDCRTEPWGNGHPILGITKEDFIKEIEKDFTIIKREDNIFDRQICLILKKK